MKKLIATLLIVCSLGFTSISFAGRSEFCAGFEEGYRAIKGVMCLVPLCPIELTPIDKTDFQAGIAAGVRAASK